MSKFSIDFMYTAHGQIEVEAADIYEAEDKARDRLEQLRELGTINNRSSESEITWSDDEVEV